MLCDKATSQERYLIHVKSKFLAKPPLQQLNSLVSIFTMLPAHSEYTAAYVY